MTWNRKRGVLSKGGGFKPRISKRAARGKVLPRLLIRCGCCDSSVEAYYGNGNIEIGGVFASTGEWEKIFNYLVEHSENSE